MGASGWTYVIDYEPSLQEAFSKARWEIFKSGEYYKLPVIDLPSYENWVAGFPPDMADDIGQEGLREMYDEEATRLAMDPQTPDEALIYSHDSGTHSLIDCMNVSSIVIYSDEETKNIFGTTTPTLAQINAEDLDSTLGRHSFCVLIAYDGEEKQKYVFFGVSGD